MSNPTLPPRAALPLRPLALVLGLVFASIPLAQAEEEDATANAPLPAASVTEAADPDSADSTDSTNSAAFASVVFESNIPDLVPLPQDAIIPFTAERVADQGLLPHADAQDPISTLFTRLFSFSPAKETTPSEFSLGSGLRIGSHTAHLNAGLDGGIDDERRRFGNGFASEYTNDDDAENDDDDDEDGDDEDDAAAPTTYSATQKLLDEGLSYLGIRYRLGGRSRETGFDCSGLVLSAFRNALGLDLPHSSRALASRGTKVSIKDLRPGDLVFFNVTRRVISHVGIYVGDGKFLHSPSTGRTVRIDALSSRYWAKRYATARRMLEENPFDLPSFEPFVGPPEPGAIR
ncbi:hypothetical protein FACS1894116_04140 [Betaproteobacteria bacterium]|nr:hypothetical protein FACS1894116_04140 [Betaproteobacteria bacterium]